MKLVVDFTSIVQFRHPYDLGGAYWSFSFVLTMGSLPVAIKFYEGQKEGEEESGNVLGLSWGAVKYLLPATAIFFFIFLVTVDRKYLHTFISMQKGNELTKKGFLDGKDDETKAYFAFTNSKKHWASIEEDVKLFVKNNWARWEHTKPKWFDERMRTNIPVSYLPEGKWQREEIMTRKTSGFSHQIDVNIVDARKIMPIVDTLKVTESESKTDRQG